MSASDPVACDTSPPTPRIKRGTGAIVCSSLGCIGWLAVWGALVPIDSSEKISRDIGVFLNLMIIAFGGGASLLLTVVGLVLSRTLLQRGELPRATISIRIAYAGLALAVIVLALKLPGIIEVLNG